MTCYGNHNNPEVMRTPLVKSFPIFKHSQFGFISPIILCYFPFGKAFRKVLKFRRVQNAVSFSPGGSVITVIT